MFSDSARIATNSFNPPFEYNMTMRRPYWIPKNSSPYAFPPIERALIHPDGLLAIGGDLSFERLIVAYHKGIFPWYSDDQPILWWSPSQRMVLFPEHLQVSHSLHKTLRKHKFTLTLDQNFRQVLQACASPRRHQDGTWITDEIFDAYCLLHERKFAHSVEAWYDGQLVGGLYGVALGKVFFGESMFSQMTDASKVAFVHLVRQLIAWGYELIDCQVYTDHLARFGAVEIPRANFKTLLEHLCDAPGYQGEWIFQS
jgi:leucyl/phenylalanyl-tRNA---protein transferase